MVGRQFSDYRCFRPSSDWSDATSHSSDADPSSDCSESSDASSDASDPSSDGSDATSDADPSSNISDPSSNVSDPTSDVSDPSGDLSDESESYELPSCSLNYFHAPKTQTPQINFTHPDGTFEILVEFTTEAMFTDGGGASCHCCEYRQYLRGYARVKPLGGEWEEQQVHMAGGVLLDPETFHEDGPDVIGHRDVANPFDSYTPAPRTEGCLFKSIDKPRYQGPAGTQVEIYFEFKGTIEDVCTGAVVATKTWIVTLLKE